MISIATGHHSVPVACINDFRLMLLAFSIEVATDWRAVWRCGAALPLFLRTQDLGGRRRRFWLSGYPRWVLGDTLPVRLVFWDPGEHGCDVPSVMSAWAGAAAVEQACVFRFTRTFNAGWLIVATSAF